MEDGGRDAGADGWEGWIERRAKPPFHFVWTRRWAVLQPRAIADVASTTEAAPLLLFFLKSTVRFLAFL